MFIVETVYVYVVSILFAFSGLDERQEDGLPEIGQDIKPKMVFVLWYPQLLHLEGAGIGDGVRVAARILKVVIEKSLQ